MDTRRSFLRTFAIAGAAMVAGRRNLFAHTRAAHPTPRAGITGANVLAKEQLVSKPKLISLFDSVREIPAVMDGIRCNCNCAHEPDLYSLLSCFEGKAMALECGVCQGQGRLVARLHKAGKTLDEIRVAVDAKFG